MLWMSWRCTKRRISSGIFACVFGGIAFKGGAQIRRWKTYNYDLHTASEAHGLTLQGFGERQTAALRSEALRRALFVVTTRQEHDFYSTDVAARMFMEMQWQDIIEALQCFDCRRRYIDATGVSKVK